MALFLANPLSSVRTASIKTVFISSFSETETFHQTDHPLHLPGNENPDGTCYKILRHEIRSDLYKNEYSFYQNTAYMFPRFQYLDNGSLFLSR